MKMLGWMKHKPESRLPGRNINNLRYVHNNTIMGDTEKELKSLLVTVKEDSEKAGLKLNSRGGMGRRWEGGSKGRGYMYTYG